MNSSELSSYWRATRTPRYSLSFAFPLFLLYEALAFSLSWSDAVAVRNGADVLLKSLFVSFGGRDGLILFGILLVGTGAALIWRDTQRSGTIRFKYLGWMGAESIAYALVFGLVAGTLTGMLLPQSLTLAAMSFGPATQLMVSLGAGIYEELLFRVILVSGLAWLARRVFGWPATHGNIFALVAGALIFSAFHYVGPYGESLALGSFTFRTVAGLLFSGLYVLRGFGITAWTHSLYDVFLAVGW